MASEPEKVRVEDDGLICPDVGPWAEDKYRLIGLYDELFATGMKHKWHKRVYVDLYSGAGYSRVKGTQTVLRASPVIALSVSNPFDRYIFCEENPDKLDALRQRVTAIAPVADVVYIEGKCDDCVEQILASIPVGSSSNRVLSLCVVDPFDFGLKFETMKKLSRVFVDFLVLLAVGMDATRNYEHYVEKENTKLDEAFGNVDWRKRWKENPEAHQVFRHFLAQKFSKSMVSLGYLERKAHDMKLVRSYEKNLPLYYLALFSKHPTAYEFWTQVMKYGNDQQTLWD